MKYCPDCIVERPTEEFGKNSSRPDGLNCYCKKHTNERSRTSRKTYPRHQRAFFMFWKYGITETEFDNLMTLQNGKCRICEVDHTAVFRPGFTRDGMKKHGLVVDHDHDSKIIRGLLCDRCNRAIGLLEDSAKILKAAAEYLETNGVNYVPLRQRAPSKIELRNAKIAQERAKFPNASATQIWEQLHKAGVKVSKRTVCFMLREN
jgi:hypothetical protein